MVARGFTLVELVVLLLIVAILVVVAVPSFEGMTALRADAQAARLRGDIRTAQYAAMTRHRSTWAVFDVVAQTWRLYEEDPLNPGPAGRVPMKDPLTQADHLATIDGTTLASASFNGTPELEFTRVGTPRDAAGAPLAAAGVVAIGGTHTVTVAPETGWVDVAP